MNDLLQQHISQHFAPEVSVESYDPLEMLSFESAMREDIGNWAVPSPWLPLSKAWTKSPCPTKRTR